MLLKGAVDYFVRTPAAVHFRCIAVKPGRFSGNTIQSVITCAEYDANPAHTEYEKLVFFKTFIAALPTEALPKLDVAARFFGYERLRAVLED